jgi:hypothetical protein
MARFVTHLPEDGATPDDYESVLSPLYAWIHVLAQRSDRTVVSKGSALRRARGSPFRAAVTRAARPVKSVAARERGYVAAVAALNRIGLGPIRRDLTGTALRQSGLRGNRRGAAAARRHAPHVIWGHSHRSGRGRATAPAEWTAVTGARITTRGSGCIQRHFLTGSRASRPTGRHRDRLRGRSPPRLRRLLGARPRELSGRDPRA